MGFFPLFPECCKGPGLSGSSVLRTGIPEGTSEKLVLLPWSSWPVSYGASLFPEGGAWLKCCWGGAGLGPSDFGVLEGKQQGVGWEEGKCVTSSYPETESPAASVCCGHG